MRPALSRNQIAIALAIVVAVLGFAPAHPVRADSGYAALLVLLGPDDYHTECIALPGDMTALDLVRASTLSATIESPTNAADAICSIDGVGCVYPGEACFCQCNADACALWTEWYWDVNRWEIAFDADERVIPHGAVEAWVWGDGMTEPPIISFADICTGVAPDDPSEAPAAPPPSDPAYPGPPAITPTVWAQPTRTIGATSTPIATRTVTTFEQPGSQFTPSAGALTPSATRFVTPAWMAPAPTNTAAASGALATPTMEAETIVITPEETPSGSPTPDRVAMLIDTSAARVRATALAASSQSGTSRRGNGGTWALGIAAAILVAYALLLQRQRRLDAAQTAALAPLDQVGAEPAEPSPVSSEQIDGASSEPLAQDVAQSLDVDDGQDAL